MDTSPLSPGAHTVVVDGVAQRYHVAGKPAGYVAGNAAGNAAGETAGDSAGTGPVLLAHPGGPGISWEDLRMPEVEKHVTVVYVEPVGTGGSDRLPSHPHGYTRARYSQALDGLIDHLGVPAVHLLGHSHGGFVAQHYALTRPDRLAGVVLYDSAPVTGPEHFAEANARMEEFARRSAGNPGLDDVLDVWRSLGSLSDDEGMTRAVRGIVPAYMADFWGREEEFLPLLPSIHGTYISGLDERMVPDMVDDRDALGSISVPTLVVVGRHDVICGPRWAEELHRGIPGSRLVVLERSGHFGHIEEPAAFADAVAGFVTGTTAG
ncbi:alpha/beta hydrolase [Microbispora sp. RL4-1S]|uniref:Alpha/beta hydrolase n=1 Tax=Microbispora oryzae TaxID=2806554 RepID=A0A941AGK4_9ACTN|nr:alpha/beta hydrolase [Microbispora oryzae]MBP2703091.1 alpha/beta hydrolase [Microbispora oryzae]